jgi:hypothetical protein
MRRSIVMCLFLLLPTMASAATVGDASTNKLPLFDGRPQATGQCDNDANTDPNKIHVKVEFVNERTKVKELVEYGEMCRRIKADQDRNQYLRDSTTLAMLTGKPLVIKTDAHGNVTVIANQRVAGGLYGNGLMGADDALTVAEDGDDVDTLRALLAAQNGTAPALNGGGGRRNGGEKPTSSAELAATKAKLAQAEKNLESDKRVINDLTAGE